MSFVTICYICYLRRYSQPNQLSKNRFVSPVETIRQMLDLLSKLYSCPEVIIQFPTRLECTDRIACGELWYQLVQWMCALAMLEMGKKMHPEEGNKSYGKSYEFKLVSAF